MCQHLVSVVTGRQHNFPQAGGRAETCWQEGVEIPPTKRLMSEPLLQLGINSRTLGELREFESSRVPVFGLRSYLPLANEAELDQGLCRWGVVVVLSPSFLNFSSTRAMGWQSYLIREVVNKMGEPRPVGSAG